VRGARLARASAARRCPCLGPVGDLGGVGAGVGAELGGRQVAGFVEVAVVVAGFEAGDLGEEVGASGGEVG
jgi:hypothetical protein